MKSKKLYQHVTKDELLCMVNDLFVLEDAVIVEFFHIQVKLKHSTREIMSLRKDEI